MVARGRAESETVMCEVGQTEIWRVRKVEFSIG